MKKIVFFVCIIIIIIVCLFSFFKKEKTYKTGNAMNEVIPEEEISISQNRMTLLTVYFVDKEKNELVPEVRNIDVKELMNSPYEKIMTFLYEGSNNSRIGKTIPENAKINSIKFENGTIFIDFNEMILPEEDKKQENKDFELIMKSIVKTFMELKEISNVVISINGNTIYIEGNI